jgi:hypothetical protein
MYTTVDNHIMVKAVHDLLTYQVLSRSMVLTSPTMIRFEMATFLTADCGILYFGSTARPKVS